jgi:hypothetical protein
VRDEEAFRPAQAYDLGGVRTWFFEVDIHSLYTGAYLSVLYAVVKGHMRLSFACQDGQAQCSPFWQGVEDREAIYQARKAREAAAEKRPRTAKQQAHTEKLNASGWQN